jgi:hypothetical protein
MVTVSSNLDDDEPAGPLSELAQLRKDAEAYEPPPLRYVHPTLPKYALVFRHDLGWDEMEKWRRKCVTRKPSGTRPEEIDPALFGRMIVAGTNIGIEVRDLDRPASAGTPIRDSNGVEVTFSNREFLGEMGVATAADAVKAFIVSDPAIASLSNQIVDDNGVGGDVEALPDPTDDDGTS